MEDHLDLINALFFVESFQDGPFNPNANKGKRGVGRSISGVTDTTWKDLKKRGMISKRAKRYNVGDEVEAGMKYFKWLLERPYIAGDERKAVAAYHMGPGALKSLTRKHKAKWEDFIPAETKIHLSNVYGIAENNKETLDKYALDAVPTYEPIIQKSFEMKKYEDGGEIKGDPKKKGKIYVLGHEPRVGDSAYREILLIENALKGLNKASQILEGKGSVKISKDEEELLRELIFNEVQALEGSDAAFNFDENSKNLDLRILLPKLNSSGLMKNRFERRKRHLNNALIEFQDGADNVKDGVDLTFRNEFDRAGKRVLGREYDDVEYIGIGNPEEFKKQVSELPQGANVMFMDHAGHKMFGLPEQDFVNSLSSINPSVCIGGSCFGGDLKKQFRKQLPESELHFTEGRPWFGFDSSKMGLESVIDTTPLPSFSGRSEGFDEFFSRFQARIDSIRSAHGLSQQEYGGMTKKYNLGGLMGPAAGLLGGVGSFLFSNYMTNIYQNAMLEQQDQNRYLNARVEPDKGRIPFNMEDGGFVSLFGEGTEPIQTEKGEVVVLPDLSITKVGAKKKHKKMKDDEVTDLLPEGSYVFSAKSKITQKEAEDIKLGRTPMKYEEGKMPSQPEEINFAEYVTKSKQTPAEIAKNIAKEFPIYEEEGDILTKRANAENKASRQLRLGILAELNESKKPKKERLEAVPQAQYGYDNEFYGGGMFDDLAMLNEQMYNDQLRRSRNLNLSSGLLSGIGLGAGTLFNLAQNPVETPALRTNRFAREAFARTPQSIVQSQMAELEAPAASQARALTTAGVDPRSLNTMLSTTNANVLREKNRMMGDQAERNSQLDRDYYRYLMGVEDANTASTVNAQNATNTNINQLLTGQFGLVSGFLENLGNIGSSSFNRRMGLDNSYLGNKAALGLYEQMLNPMGAENVQTSQSGVSGVNNSSLDGLFSDINSPSVLDGRPNRGIGVDMQSFNQSPTYPQLGPKSSVGATAPSQTGLTMGSLGNRGSIGSSLTENLNNAVPQRGVGFYSSGVLDANRNLTPNAMSLGRLNFAGNNNVSPQIGPRNTIKPSPITRPQPIGLPSDTYMGRQAMGMLSYSDLFPLPLSQSKIPTGLFPSGNPQDRIRTLYGEL